MTQNTQKHSNCRLKPSWQRNRRFIFLRFLVIFGGISASFVFAILLILYLYSDELPQSHLRSGLLLIVHGIPIAFIILSFLVGNLAFQRLGKPFADIMSASDTIANGDLSVRLHENNAHKELDNLAKRFNNMVAELERSDQQRRNLTADIAHELRTPLQVIQGNLEGLLDGVYESTEENIENILDETRLLTRLVNDLQILSLAESGELPLRTCPILVADLLIDAADGFASRALAQNVTLRVEKIDTPLEITADYDRMLQVITNLLANALRHTPENGHITLRGEAIPDGVHIIISDTGIGISPKELPYIFDRFWRGDKSRARTEGNSGLGLAITKHLVLAHKGTITVKSKERKGTTFIIELPV